MGEARETTEQVKLSPEQFVYWLQGFFELSGAKTLSAQQVHVIKNHLALVFTKVTPDGDITDMEAFVNGFNKIKVTSPADDWQDIFNKQDAKPRPPFQQKSDVFC